MILKLIKSNNLIFIAYIFLVIGLPLSKFLIGFSQFWLFGAWILNGNFKEKINSWIGNKALWLLCGVFFMHIIGLIYTNDFSFAMRDIRIKLPLLVFPLLIASSPLLEKSKFYILMWVFILANFIGTIISMMVLMGAFNYEITDVRTISIFTSHIRYALLICFSIFILGYFFIRNKNENPLWLQISIVILILWFFIFLVILESVTGITVLIITLLMLLIYHVFANKSLKYKIVCLLLMAGVFLCTYVFIKTEIDRYYTVAKFDFSNIEMKTKFGNNYEHLPEVKLFENGHPVWMYVCKPELKQEWEKRSSVPIEGNDKKGQLIINTLVRFLTSKGLRKDAEGVKQLSDEEIQSIEKGIANVNYQGLTNLKGRIQQIIWEVDQYKNGGNPSGHSVIQRFEYWKTALHIIKKNPWIGVGTGDVDQAFLHEYYENNSPLSMKWRLRTHNQYLTFAVTFGLPGFVFFVFVMLYILFKDEKYKDYLFAVCWLIVCLSMLSEDTFETQAGVSFFAFFNALLLFRNSLYTKK